MKKIIIADFDNFDAKGVKLGNAHYAEQFSNNGYEILWFTPLWSKLTYIQDKSDYKSRKSISKPCRHQVAKNIFTISAYTKKLYGNHFFSKNINRVIEGEKFISPDIKKTLSIIGFDKVDILWISNPKQYWLKNVVNYKKLVYRMADDFEQFCRYPKNIATIDKKLSLESDTCCVISQNLIEKKKKIRKDLVYLPNGADINNFIRGKYVRPEELKNDTKKKVIYVGAISEWFDTDVIKYSAKKLPNINFYIVGKPNIDLSTLSNIKNVHLLGKQSYEVIPNYLYYSDVAIIPFKVNQLTDSVSPIKLYEYMSIGLNVVSTNFKEMNYIESPAYIAQNYDEFCEYIELGIENKERNKEKNIEFAKENTWEKRFKQIINELT